MTTSNRSKKKPLTEEQKADADRLKALWEAWQDKRQMQGERRISQEDFGVKHGIGKQAAVWQFLNGATALNLKTALAFSNAIGCKVSDFSPTLAERLGPAAVVEGRTVTPVASVFAFAEAVREALPPTLQAHWGMKPLGRMTADSASLSVDYLSERVVAEVVYRVGSVSAKNVSTSMLKLVLAQTRSDFAKTPVIILLSDRRYEPPDEVYAASKLWGIAVKHVKTAKEAAETLVEIEQSVATAQIATWDEPQD